MGCYRGVAASAGLGRLHCLYEHSPGGGGQPGPNVVLACRVQGLGCGVQGSEFMVFDLGLKV